ncbi:hypothetical protein [Hyalangium rubrum]|uniref:Lipoprotein n=1 Tax=Hyalangium rubrum TaxID=3103134 RepID=A0ABU5HDD0_9BACT|nr:hypothetical protein [Hyalangium sp. s54d21]MDY7231469.1 hypothetical protein [Hyalangium sp. s54d21]
MTQLPAAPAPACPTEKLRFTRETSCRNDGSVEFCLPKDAQVVERVRRLAPEIQGPMGGAGRIRCDLSREDLYFFPTDNRCLEPHGALTDEAWASLCRVAADPAISGIAPTWYE